MGKWKECVISDIGTVVGGATPSTKKRENYDRGTIPWITPKDLSNFSGRYIDRGERNITQKGFDSCSAQMIPKNTVLFSSRAPIGYLAIANRPICTNQGFKSVIPNEDTDFLFLYYLLKYKKDDIEHMGSGTTFKEISGKTMKNIAVSVPVDIMEQRKIASILSAFDDKIELNNAINKNLEQQAQAIFRSLFIDSSEKVKWSIGNFSDLIVSTVSGDWGKESEVGNNTEMVYCIRGADIPDVKAGNKGKMPIRFILPKNYAAKRLSAGDVIVEISGGSPTQSTGRAAAISQSLLDRYDKGMVCTNFCKAIKPKVGYSMFIYYYWQYMYDQKVFFSYENGTTGIKNLDLKGFIETEEIVLPPYDVVADFDSFCQVIFNKIFANGLENEKLSLLRDSLLSKLMSGELDVSELDL
ncbi:MAG: restriction endonuclease subunit S [Firmicutes bacterium]|nr:restriction endonuclease subunit S [Bacillota bacterium]